MTTRTIMAITKNCVKNEGPVNDTSAKGLVKIISFFFPKFNNNLVSFCS